MPVNLFIEAETICMIMCLYIGNVLKNIDTPTSQSYNHKMSSLKTVT